MSAIRPAWGRAFAIVIAAAAGGTVLDNGGFDGAFGAEPAKPAPKIDPNVRKPGESCGELARGSRAYRDCLAAQSRAPLLPAQGQPASDRGPQPKPSFSSR